MNVEVWILNGCIPSWRLAKMVDVKAGEERRGTRANIFFFLWAGHESVGTTPYMIFKLYII